MDLNLLLATMAAGISFIAFTANSQAITNPPTVQAISDCGSATVPVTRTLPVLHIDTDGGAVIDQKDKYIDGTCWLEAFGEGDFADIGTETEPLKLGIRGRGNATWINFDKKPYKIKLDKKTSILGMPKSKHWALLAYYECQNSVIECIGRELSRRMGLPWTPSMQPVEVMLNGRNIGVYYISETVRIEKDRVNIYEQPDNSYDTDNLDGGWLMEIDNYPDHCQYSVVQDKDGQPFTARFTYHTPEEHSDLQQQWLKQQLSEITDVVYAPYKDDAALEALIDYDSLARYYLVQELLGNYDAFFGSTYFHKDLGQKWTFGPMWDMGWSFNPADRHQSFIYARQGCRFVWIEEMLKFPGVIHKISEVWDSVYPGLMTGMDSIIDDFLDRIDAAYVLSYEQIWPMEWYRTIDYMRSTYKQRLHDRGIWLDGYISGKTAGIENPAVSIHDREIVTAVYLGDGTVNLIGISGPLVSVAVADINGHYVDSEIISYDTLRINAIPGIYFIAAKTSSADTLRARVLTGH